MTKALIQASRSSAEIVAIPASVRVVPISQGRKPMVEISNLYKSYGRIEVLKGCDLVVERGEVVVICGPSGSGKSTLIKCVNGLEPFDRGALAVDGVAVGDRASDMTSLRARIGMVFQHFELYPHLTVLQNICLAQVHVLKRSKVEAQAKARALSLALVFRIRRALIPLSFPAGSSNASQSRGRWRWIRWRCCSTSRLPRSIRK